jgi:hypothetical protein
MKDSLEQATDSLVELASQIKKTVKRVKRHRGHKLRNTLIVVGGAVTAAVAALATRRMRSAATPIG